MHRVLARPHRGASWLVGRVRYGSFAVLVVVHVHDEALAGRQTAGIEWRAAIGQQLGRLLGLIVGHIAIKPRLLFDLLQAAVFLSLPIWIGSLNLYFALWEP